MPAVALPAVRFLLARPKLVDAVSLSRTGDRAISAIVYGDSFWRVQMRTVPMSASEVVAFGAWADDAVRRAQQSVIYTPNDYCLPRAYRGNPTAPAVNDPGALVGVTNGYQVVINSVTNGLTLGSGDRLSFQSGDYRSLHVVKTGAVAASGSIALTLTNPVPSYIVAGAVTKFKSPELNMRVVSEIDLPDEFNPSATFTLQEVPK